MTELKVRDYSLIMHTLNEAINKSTWGSKEHEGLDRLWYKVVTLRNEKMGEIKK